MKKNKSECSRKFRKLNSGVGVGVGVRVSAMINDAVSRTVVELKKQNLLKSSQSPFQKTEQLLYNYNHFKSAITDKLAQIEELQIVGVPKQSKSITSYGGTGAIFDVDIEEHKRDERLGVLRANMEVTERFISVIDNALCKIQDDDYFPIIRMKYFENFTREEIAEKLNCDVSTITRNKNRLIGVLKVILFSDEVLTEIFG